MNRTIDLSQSRITLFEQCPKRLWRSVHRPDLAEETPGTRMAFADGYRVGDLACSLYPVGVMISAEHGLGQTVADTEALLGNGWDQPVFEATFAHGGVMVRVDLLLPDGDGWHVAGVKNTMGVKDYHLGDPATQIWVMRGAGVPVTTAAWIAPSPLLARGIAPGSLSPPCSASRSSRSLPPAPPLPQMPARCCTARSRTGKWAHPAMRRAPARSKAIAAAMAFDAAARCERQAGRAAMARTGYR